jgi:hypothetical protein
MTIYGKILIFMNLVFSLLTGAFIVTAYVNRTNWKGAYDQLDKNYKVAEANADAYYAEAKEAKNRADADVKAINDKLKDAEKNIETLARERDQKQKDLDTERQKALASNTNATDSDAELKRRQSEVGALETRLADANARYLRLQQDFKQEQDKEMAATIAYNSEHDRNLRLLETLKTEGQELEAAKKKLANLGASGTGGPLTRNPPPEDVEGIITESDPKTGLVTISIGSDHGISAGNTLEAFRTKPPQYLGTIRILDVQPHKAVGRLTAPPRYGPLKEGDIVATKIMSTRRSTLN